MNDVLIYEDGKIRITRNVFSNGHGDDFMIPTIRGIRDVYAGKSMAPLILGVGLLAAGNWQEFFIYSQYVLSGIGGVFVLWFLTQKPRYHIMIMTPAGEIEAFSTKDEIQHKNILVCLKRAMSLHKA